MKHYLSGLGLVLTLCVGTSVIAATAASTAPTSSSEVAPVSVKVDDAWVRATVPQQQATGAFMRLTAPSDMSLVGAASDAAAAVEIHEMAMQNEVMRMREVPKVALPAGQTVELKPGGYHIMLLDLKTQVKEGAQIPMALTFENSEGVRSTVSVQVPVRAITGVAPKHDHAGGHGATHAPAKAHGAH